MSRGGSPLSSLLGFEFPLCTGMLNVGFCHSFHSGTVHLPAGRLVTCFVGIARERGDGSRYSIGEEEEWPDAQGANEMKSLLRVD